jgi:hypothetical protein
MLRVLLVVIAACLGVSANAYGAVDVIATGVGADFVGSTAPTDVSAYDDVVAWRTEYIYDRFTVRTPDGAFLIHASIGTRPDLGPGPSGEPIVTFADDGSIFSADPASRKVTELGTFKRRVLAPARWRNRLAFFLEPLENVDSPKRPILYFASVKKGRVANVHRAKRQPYLKKPHARIDDDRIHVYPQGLDLRGKVAAFNWSYDSECGPEADYHDSPHQHEVWRMTSTTRKKLSPRTCTDRISDPFFVDNQVGWTRSAGGSYLVLGTHITQLSGVIYTTYDEHNYFAVRFENRNWSVVRASSPGEL